MVAAVDAIAAVVAVVENRRGVYLKQYQRMRNRRYLIMAMATITKEAVTAAQMVQAIAINNIPNINEAIDQKYQVNLTVSMATVVIVVEMRNQ